MESESDVSRSVIDEIHSWDIKGDEKEGESGVTRSIIDELHSLDIQGDQKEGESGVTQSIIDQLHSWNIQGEHLKVKAVLLEISLMNFILQISTEIK